MPYALVHDIPASWHDYEHAAAAAIDPAPAGLILHLAGPTEEGLRIIEIWASEAEWERFQAERLAPVIAALDGPGRPPTRFRALQARHLVLGDAVAGADRRSCKREERQDA
jgi:hypothetical protein